MERSTRLVTLSYLTAKQASPTIVKSPVARGVSNFQSRTLSTRPLTKTPPNRSLLREQNTSRFNNPQLVSPSSRSRIQASPSIPSVSKITQFRHASTTTTPTASISTSAPSSNGSSTHASRNAPQTLDWQTFFRLRTVRRRYSLVSSIFTSILTVSASITLVTSTPLSDTITSLSPLPDPFITLGLFTFISFGIGWLIGPSIGQTVWRIVHRGQVPGFMAREKDFFERVKKYRVDPRGASAQNPVPDYYGERVGSRDQWRTWLKDQRAFNRKREGKATGMGGGLGFRGKGLSE